MHGLRIEITNYCNRKCSYCFFYDLLSSNKEEMSLDELNTVLDYCKDENIDSIALQGGEPTTHTYIDKIFNIFKKRRFEIELFTNGIFDTKLLKQMDGIRLNCLINYNHPDSYNNLNQWRLVNKNIKEMIDKKFNVSLGYNLYDKNPNYSFFIKAIKKYKLKSVRWDIARPSGKFTNIHFNLEDIFKIVNIITKFMQECIAAGTFPNLDCQLPFCITSGQEFNFMRKYLFSPPAICRTELNIGPRLRLSVCPASVMTKDIYLTDFKKISQAKKFMGEIEDRLRWDIYLLKKCKDCFYRVHRLCQGGCIGNKKIKENKVITREDLDRFLLDKKGTVNNFGRGASLRINKNEGIDYFKTGLAFINENRFNEALKMFTQVENDRLIKEERRFIENFLKRIVIKYKESSS